MFESLLYKLYLIKVGRIRTFGKCNWQPTTNGLNLLQQRTLSTSILLIHSTSAPSFPLDLSSALNPANHLRVLPCLLLPLLSWSPFVSLMRTLWSVCQAEAGGPQSPVSLVISKAMALEYLLWALDQYDQLYTGYIHRITLYPIHPI